MKKLSHGILSILLALVLLAGASVSAPLTASAADAQGNIYPSLMNLHGDCGTDATYYCFEDGSMAIFGTSDIANYSLLNGSSTAPWFQGLTGMVTSSFINKIAIEYGVTGIGDYSFYLKEGQRGVILYNIDIANTVTKIGKYAFANQQLEEVVIPPSVTSIGEKAFGNMSSLKKLTYYGDPSQIDNWDQIVTSHTDVHILSGYSHEDTDNIHFVSDMGNPYAGVDNKERNIAVYYGSVNSHVFNGAAPFIIVGKFDGIKKSVTHGSNGFISCVKQGNDYFLLTDNTTGELKKTKFDQNNHENHASGGYEDNATTPLKLNISHEYIGPNTVKMIYTIKNTGYDTINGIKVGGAGDIKIGADDRATIEPINEENTQVGFYMKSGSEAYDKATDSNNYATLGFIGQNVKVGSSGNETSQNANFLYGELNSKASKVAAGAFSLRTYPYNIFTKRDYAKDSGELSGVDSGMSFYWGENGGTWDSDNGFSLDGGESKQFAVLFSVYGATNDSDAQSSMKDDAAADESSFVNITWNFNDKETEPTTVTQVIKKGETPVYSGANPVKLSSFSDDKYYHFLGWSETKDGELLTSFGNVNNNTTYFAKYEEMDKTQRLFKGHSVSLLGDIALNFYLGPTHDTEVTDAHFTEGKVKVKFEWTVAGEKQEKEENVSTVKEDINGNEYYKATCHLPAAEMAYNIHATAYIDGVKHWDTDRYSVKEYGMELVNGTGSEKVKNLAKAMLNYGAMAQILFDRANADFGLANAELSAADQSAISGGTDAEVANNIKTAIISANPSKARTNMSAKNPTGLEYAGSSVVFLTKTSLRHYYRITKDDYAKTGEGAAFKFYVENDNYVYFERTDIPAAELDNFQDFEIEGNHYYYSALDYSRNVLLNPNSTAAEKNLARATYLYNKAANEYVAL